MNLLQYSTEELLAFLEEHKESSAPKTDLTNIPTSELIALFERCYDTPEEKSVFEKVDEEAEEIATEHHSLLSPSELKKSKVGFVEDPDAPVIEIDEKTLVQQVLESDAFKQATKLQNRPSIQGTGLPASRVAAIESRLRAVELSGSSVNYISVVEGGSHTFTKTQLSSGVNIIGVNADAPVDIRLPDNLPEGTIVKIKDESLNASTNNINVSTYRVI